MKAKAIMPFSLDQMPVAVGQIVEVDEKRFLYLQRCSLVKPYTEKEKEAEIEAEIEYEILKEEKKEAETKQLKIKTETKKAKK